MRCSRYFLKRDLSYRCYHEKLILLILEQIIFILLWKEAFRILLNSRRSYTVDHKFYICEKYYFRCTIHATLLLYTIEYDEEQKHLHSETIAVYTTITEQSNNV